MTTTPVANSRTTTASSASALEELPRISAAIKAQQWVHEDLRPYINQPVDDWDRRDVLTLIDWLKKLPVVGASLTPVLEPFEEPLQSLSLDTSVAESTREAQDRLRGRLVGIEADLRDLKEKEEREEKRSGEAWEALRRAIDELSRLAAILAAAVLALGLAISAAYHLVAAWAAALWITLRAGLLHATSWAQAFLADVLSMGAAAIAEAETYLVDHIRSCRQEVTRLTDAFLDSQPGLVALIEQIRQTLVRWRVIPGVEAGTTGLTAPGGTTGQSHITGDEITGGDITGGDVDGDGELGDFVSPDPAYLSTEQRELLNEPVRRVGPLHVMDHSNDLYKVEFDDGSSAIYKPQSGEKSVRDAIPTGSLGIRETAAYRLDLRLGFDLVPTTTAWEGPYGPGSLQRWVENAEPGGMVNEYTALDQQKMAVFDYVAGNLDRNGGNYLTAPDSRPVAIDNGLSFPVSDDGTIRSDFVVAHLNQPLSTELVGQLRTLDLAEIERDLLRSGVEQSAVDGVIRRLEEIRRHGQITGEAWSGGIVDAVTRRAR